MSRFRKTVTLDFSIVVKAAEPVSSLTVSHSKQKELWVLACLEVADMNGMKLIS